MKAVIFDLDGTILDSMPMWRNLGKLYLKNRGIELEEKIAQKMTTLSLRMNSIFLKEYFKLEEESEKIYNDFNKIIMDFYLNKAKPKEFAINTLKEFYKKGYDIVLGTATSDEFVGPVLNKFEIKNYFKFIQTCDMVGISKNDSNYFKIISEKLGHKPKDILLFDDAIFALKAAKEIGIVTVGLYDESSSNYWDEIKSISDYAIKNFKEWNVE